MWNDSGWFGHTWYSRYSNYHTTQVGTSGLKVGRYRLRGDEQQPKSLGSKCVNWDKKEG